MSADSDRAPKRGKRQPTGDHDAGYCRPPKEHQFKKGEPSRNPAGRPRGVRYASVFDEVSQKKIAYSVGGKQLEATLIELTMQRSLDAAVKGDSKAQGEYLKLWHKVQQENAKDPAPLQDPITVTVYTDGASGKRRQPAAPRPPRRKPARKRPAKRKKETARDIFNRLVARTILVRDGKAQTRMSYEQAIWRSIFSCALKGDAKAQALINRFTDLGATYGGLGPSSIIDENGVLTIRVNIGKPPGLLDDERKHEADRDGDKEEDE